MKRFKKIGKWILKAGVILVITFLVFELLYRYNVIDFYKTELTSLNDLDSIEKSQKKKLLVFGDSFSADNNGYVKMMQDQGDWTVINSAVSGISFKQIKNFFEDRVEEFNPDAIIIQLYVGNDFEDYHHSRNWSELSFVRNCYSLIGDRLTGLQYLNYKLGGRFSNGKVIDPKINIGFNPKSYNHRERRYFKADSSSLKNAIQLVGDQLSTYEEMRDDISTSLSEVNVPVLILVLPHAAQVSNEYRKNMERIGAYLPMEITFGKFTFYDQLKSDLKSFTNVKVVSPLLRFRLNIKRKELFYPNDPHLTQFGQEELFNFVNDKLKSMK